MSTDAFELKLERLGRTAKFEIRVFFEDKLVFCDRHDLVSEKGRSRAVNTLRDKFAFEEDTLVGRFIAAVAESERDTAAEDAELGKLDSSIVTARPEQFILPECSGIAVSVPSKNKRGEIRTQELYYVSWQGGERETIPVVELKQLGERPVRVTPQPQVTFDSAVDEWLPSARTKWLQGEPVPSLCDVIGQLARLYDANVKFPRFVRDEEICPITGESWDDTDQATWASVLAMFTLLSYATPAFSAVPYLWISGPIGSGKTRILELLDRLVFRPILASSTSAASIYRLLHYRGGTFLFDEAEVLNASKAEDVHALQLIMNSGYKRSSAYATRTEKSSDGQFTVKRFYCYGVKAIASIYPISPTLVSRAIPLKMMMTKDQHYSSPISPDDPCWASARAACYAFTLAHGQEWLALGKQSPVGDVVYGRSAEVWGPILAIAQWYDRETGDQLTPCVVDLVQQCRDIETPEPFDERAVLVMQMTGQLLLEGKTPQCREIVDACMAEDRAVAKGLTSRKVAAVLKNIGVRTTRGHRNVYQPSALRRLRQVQLTYGIALEIPKHGSAT